MAIKNKAKASFSPRFEALESREMMTVTYHGGATMPHVEVQAVYYGQDWSTNRSLFSQTGALEGSLNSLVHGSYMDMLTNAGYGVGRGSFDGGKILLKNIDKGYYLTDTQIRSDLQSMITSNSLKNPLFDPNRLYVVYVEPGVAIENDNHNNETSINDFRGYHTAFAGTGNFSLPFLGQFPVATDIHYAVIAYPGGWNPTFPSKFNTFFDQLTAVTSHEVAEAATDPNVAYSTKGWYDDNKNDEIGESATRGYVNLNGYCVQTESDKSDNPMSPAGSTIYWNQDLINEISRIHINVSVFGVGMGDPIAQGSGSAILPTTGHDLNSWRFATTAHQNEFAFETLTNRLSSRGGLGLTHLSASAVDQLFGDSDDSWDG